MIYMFLSKNTSLGDIYSSNLSCFFCFYIHILFVRAVKARLLSYTFVHIHLSLHCLTEDKVVFSECHYLYASTGKTFR